MRLGLAAVCAAMMMVFCNAALAQDVPAAAPTAKVTIGTLPDIKSPQAGFDTQKAINGYLAQISGKARAQSDSYFEGGYVLIFVDAIYAVIVSAILLWLGISARIRDFAQRTTSSRFLQVPIYAIAYLILAAAMTFPLTIYEGFFREHAYGLSNQNFAQWFGEFGIGFGVSLLALTILLTIIYAVIRRAPRTWWMWCTLVTIAFAIVGGTIAPVFIAPLTNHYQPLPEGPLKSRILSIARSEGIPVTNVYEFDASKQSKRISANVSGMFGTTRISMTDNLLKRCTPDEVVAVLGHEMGHYVLDHTWFLISWLGILIFVGFAFMAAVLGAVVRRFGKTWKVTGIDDPAGIPAFMAVASVFFLLATPVQNTITRTAEQQADMFGINAVRQPDAFARVTLMLSEYRKLDPSPLEEFVFYDHPSGRTRVTTAMRWKAEHLNDWDIKNGPVSPQ